MKKRIAPPVATRRLIPATMAYLPGDTWWRLLGWMAIGLVIYFT